MRTHKTAASEGGRLAGPVVRRAGSLACRARPGQAGMAAGVPSCCTSCRRSQRVALLPAPIPLSACRQHRTARFARRHEAGVDGRVRRMGDGSRRYARRRRSVHRRPVADRHPIPRRVLRLHQCRDHGHPGLFVHDRSAINVYRAISFARIARAWFGAGDWLRMGQRGFRWAAVLGTGGHYVGAGWIELERQRDVWRSRAFRVFSVQQPLAELVTGLNAFRPGDADWIPKRTRTPRRGAGRWPPQATPRAP